MRIRSIEAIPLDIGFSQTFRFGTTDRRRSHNVILKMTTDEGLVGYGEACPVSAFTRETQESITAIVEREIPDLLVGADPLDRNPILERLEPLLIDRPFTLGAIDMALWDLAGHALDVPVWALLGGRYRDHIPVHGSIGIADAGTMAENAREQVAMGYQVLKLYAGRDSFGDDLQRIQSVRAAVGPDVAFILDLNGLWDTETCLRALPILEGLNVIVLEQPLPPDDEHGQALITRSTRIAIAADESVFTPRDVARIGRDRAADTINLGLSKLGGLRRASECAAVARASGLTVMVGSVLELEIATAAGLHLAASLAELPYPSYLLGPLKYERQITTDPFVLNDGAVDVPRRPGLGVEVDAEIVSRLDMRR